MAPRVKDEDLAGLIHTLMRRSQLTVQQIRHHNQKHPRNKIKPVDVHGIGEFDCRDCKRTWSSSYSWVQVDLELQRVTKRWRMRCKRCFTQIESNFDLDMMESMVNNVIKALKGEQPTYIRRSNGELRERPPPHIMELCEKCGWGRERCWKSPPYRPPREFRIKTFRPPRVNAADWTSMEEASASESNGFLSDSYRPPRVRSGNWTSSTDDASASESNGILSDSD